MHRVNKQLVRENMLNDLVALSLEERRATELQLNKHLFASHIWKKANVIGITCSTELEWNTRPIIEQAWEEKKIVVVPKTIPTDSQMEFYEIEDFSQLTVGYRGILEPSLNINKLTEKQSIDLLIVPGIVFDEYGYRIGFGGGYYDRFLVDFSNMTVSLLSTLQLVTKLPIEKHDIHVQYLITEKGCHKVKAKSEV